MTIANNYLPTKVQGNGVVDTFTFNWQGLNASYVIPVFELVATGVQTEQTTGFTVTLDADGVGGSVVFTTPPPATVYVIIAREVPAANATQYKTSSGFQGVVVENNFDAEMAVVQQLQDALDRSIKTKLAGTQGIVFPDLVANKYLTNDGVDVLSWTEPTNVDYPSEISLGLDANKAASPAQGDMYVATDTAIFYICYTASVWTASGNVSLGTANQVPYVNAGADDLDYSANMVFDGTNLTLGGDVRNVAYTDYSSISTIVGFDPVTAAIIYYKKVGNRVFIEVDIYGTSDTDYITFTLPYTSHAIGRPLYFPCYVVDNGTVQATVGSAVLPSASATVTVNIDLATSAGFTTSGLKEVVASFSYEAV